MWLMPLRICVHVTHGTWLNGSFRAMCQVRIKDKCQVVRKVGKLGGSFPTLINSVDRQEKKRKKEKQKKKKKEKNNAWEKKVKGRERKRRFSWCFDSRSSIV